ncbi:hypothetical protein [Chitinophaga nivalis]|uniref:ABC transporter permease n=1 Tax=Chitinophaga nivalis TaxID=2991709 RepID=A0ABT3IJD7_9BACT|nr:hypothetical protein [Chitinophaga nivalis]MCW3466247.1 hypothetical protein [Chitinophaga nivalis]MCW3484062.1 hypothetical protein [Chitinophaga nivalis]
MKTPLTRILLRIFATGFYRAHAGLLLFAFVVVVSYGIFINTAGDVTREAANFYNVVVIRTFISNPVTMWLLFAGWILYTLKSWQYVSAQLRVAEHGFLFYSSTALPRLRQFRSWWCVQLVILLPAVMYGVAALIFGWIFHYYLLPLITILFLAALISGSALVYVWQVNRLQRGLVLTLPGSWHWRAGKPFFSLFLYHLFYKVKTGTLLTKTFSLFCLTSGLYGMFSDNRQDLRVTGMLVLTAVTAHAYLIYQEYRFEMTSLAFARSFPYSRHRLFGEAIVRYSVLLLPEMICLAGRVPPAAIGLFLLYAVSTLLCFRGWLYALGLRMNRYLPLLFFMYLLWSGLLLYHEFWLSICINGLLGYGLYYLSYYRFRELV